jgi:histone H1/5
MVGKAISALKERGGSSRQAILKYIMANFNVGKDAKSVNAHLKLSLRAGVKNKSLKQSKGTGASGSFRIGEVNLASFPTLKLAMMYLRMACLEEPPRSFKALIALPTISLYFG